MPIRIAPDGQNSGLWDALQRAQHDAGLLACRGGVRLEAAVRHAVDDAGAVQRLHGGQGVGRDAALVREGSDRLLVKLHAEVLTRYKALDIEPYSGFVNPQYELVEKNGKVVDVKVSYPNDYVKQMLEYSRDYSFLPNLN